MPEEPAVAALLATCPDFGARLTPLAAHLAKPQPGFSYTQWEAYLAIYRQREGEKGQRQLAVLRLLGLFDRPASKDCLEALRREPVIAGLTEPLVGLAPREWTLVASRLEEINLLTVQVDGSVDAHPLLREYFGQRVRQQQPETWRAAHRRLYEHLCATTKEGDQPTLEDLQPLYQAVAHGCQAGMQQETCAKVYGDRLEAMATARRELDAAVDSLRRAGQSDHLPCGLLTRGWLRSLTGPRTDSTSSPQAGAGSARGDLDEAWEIAERGPMPLFLADIHLHRTRLFHAVKPYPWVSPRKDLAEARRLIEKHGYWRRKGELEDAEAAASNY